MKRVVLLALVIVAAAFAASWMSAQPGSVTVRWLGWRADTSVAVFVLAIALVVLAGGLVYRFWRFLITAPRALLERLATRRRQRGYAALSSGMIAVAAGDAAEAERQARRAESLLRDATLTRLLRAQVARLAGDTHRAQRSYEELAQDPDTALVGVLGLLDQAEDAGDTLQALQLAEKAHRLQPGARGVLRRLFDIQVRTRRWADADRTLIEASRRRAFPPAEMRQMRAAVLVERSRIAEEEGDRDAAVRFAREAQSLDPRRIPAVTRYARLLGGMGKTRRAVRLLEKAWSDSPHPDLAAAYGELFAGEPPLARVKRFQRLLSFRPDHPEGHLALAQAALQATLWGEARAHLGRAADAAVTPRVCRMMAELEEAEHDNGEAARRWLSRAASSDGDAAWVCDSCGAVGSVWHAACERCGAFDSLRWQPPPRAGHAAADLPPPGGEPGRTAGGSDLPAGSGVPALPATGRNRAVA